MWFIGNTRKAPRPNRKPREGSVAAFPYPNQPNFTSTRGFSCKRKGGPNSPFKNGYYSRYNGNTTPPPGWIEKHCEDPNNANEPTSRSNRGSVASDPGSTRSNNKATAKSRARNARIASKYGLKNAKRREENLKEHLTEHPHV